MFSTFGARRCGLLGLVVLSVLAGACQTQDTDTKQDAPPPLPEDELVVEEPWVRPASPGDSTTLFMTFANGKSEPDTLLGARAPVFQSMEIRKPAPDTATNTEMEVIESLPLPPDTRTEMSPSGARVTLNSVAQSLSPGGTLLVTMEFAQAGLQQVRATVRSSPASGQQ